MKKVKKFVHVVVILNSDNDLTFLGCFKNELKAQKSFNKSRKHKYNTKYRAKVELE